VATGIRIPLGAFFADLAEQEKMTVLKIRGSGVSRYFVRSIGFNEISL
jgi:hypothetical protein